MSLVELPPSDDGWYLNLLWFDQCKCLLLTHAGTVFSIFIPDVRKAELAPTGRYIVDAVVGALRAEGLPVDALGELDAHDALLAKTASRQVLGFMDDIASHISYAVYEHRSVRDVDIVDVPAGTVVRVAPHVVRSVWNEGPDDVELVIAAMKIDDPRGDAETVPDFWPE